MQETIKVAAAVAMKDGRVLITRRASGQRLAGFWEFPGGKLDGAETPSQCIVRELAEELSVKAIPGVELTRSRHEQIELIAVEVRLVSESLTLTVHDKAEWVNVADLTDYQLAPADVPIARHLMGQI